MFWHDRLPDSREGTCWRHVLETLTVYRLIRSAAANSHIVAKPPPEAPVRSTRLMSASDRVARPFLEAIHALFLGDNLGQRQERHAHRVHQVREIGRGHGAALSAIVQQDDGFGGLFHE